MPETAEFIFLILTGFAANLYGSVVGGGGLVKFPAMIFLGVPIDVAIGTNKLSLVFSDASGSWAFYKKNLIDSIVLKLAALTIPLTIVGSLAATEVNKKVINTLVAFSLIILLFLLPFLSRIQPKQKSKKQSLSFRSTILLTALTTVLSFYGGFYGVGFGTFMIFTFVMITKSSFLSACANARFLSFVISVVASIVFIQKGLIDYAVVIPLSIGSVIGARVGVNTVSNLDSKWIKILLASVVFLSVIKLLFDTFGG